MKKFFVTNGSYPTEIEADHFQITDNKLLLFVVSGPNTTNEAGDEVAGPNTVVAVFQNWDGVVEVIS